MRRVRRKVGNKEKVFGCDLLEHLTASSQGIPLVLRICSEFVEHHGVVDGIYRLSGVSSNIQKLRGEFESDGSPDLNKDLYLQDIHCVSSLCKAYFRELPNPLLTYQLYDKFAEAVAIQLEEERLVKIKDVLKELPALHHRTLEFLMRHLVKMASYSSETNMHARNLAIVWAPNLLRSKDIEASGFNGTAAFMEVRVQSIVVEFILTHVPQLFPEEGVSSERRKSLPSPSAMPSPEEGFFRSAPPNFGNISPGHGPLPIRPYHAIIEGTDKRKGSLKGRKWMSIFNIGGRIQDQRRRHKHSAKEKERPALRPARSMDSLSTPSYPNEGTRRSGQHPPSTNISPLVTASVQAGPDATAPPGGLGSSEYAVTYRRGTGLVIGNAGTPGTYTALDPEGLGLPVSEGVQTRSPGLSSKASRRAAMHITGPTLVTVPLHITSNLALGVLQGGGSDRIILRERDKDGGDKVESKERAEKVERKECRAMEWNVEESKKVEEDEKNHREKEAVDIEGNKEGAGGVSEEKGEGAEEKPGEEVKDDGGKQELVMGDQDVSKEQRATSVNSKTEEDKDEDAAEDDQESDNSEYMDMKGEERHSATQHGNDGVFDASDVLNSTEVEGDDHELSGYVQDNFDFLDQMDCSVLDHIDTSVPCQVNEFSVEPPGHSDDEYELMEQAQSSNQPTGQKQPPQRSPDVHTQSQTELNPHRPLSLDLPSRHTKSLSLPYMTSPVHGPEESFSEGEISADDSDNNLYDSEEDESMFVQSLPSDFFLSNLSGLKPDADTKDCSSDRSPVHELPSPEAEKCPPLNLELSACEITPSRDQGQIEVDGGADEDELGKRQTIRKREDDDEAQHGRGQLENYMQSQATEEHLSIMKNAQSEKSLTSDASTTSCEEFPLESNEDSNELNTVTGNKAEDVKEMVDIPPSDSPPHVASYAILKESADAPSEESSDTSVIPAQHPRGCFRGDATEREDRSQQSALEIKESDENMKEEFTEGGGESLADKKHKGRKEQDSLICTNSEIWNELEDVVCEVIEDKECEKSEEEVVAAEAHLVEDEEEKEQSAGASGEKTVEVEENEPNETNIIAEEEESQDKTVGKPTAQVMQRESEEEDPNLPRSELEKVDLETHAFGEEERHHNRGEVVLKEAEENKEKADVQSRAQPSVDKQLPAIRSDMKELKGNQMCENRDGSLGGVGRKLVTSKHPKVYQVKAVPVVPPKPQHCKITALTLRQQQQQRERRDADRGRENTARALADQDRASSAEQLRDRGDESADRKERPVHLRERRRDGAEGATRDTSRNSPLSMCFDEAVAIATLRREKERVREGDAEAEGSGK